ncbi:MAG: ParB/RepB/Spo0J family partition protein [Alcaligenaceae bacterium]|nr:MAG: ParB/RepB/Spo0J family partition protein [Alcaligenaceae bacterium]
MSGQGGLDLSSLSQFRASALLRTDGASIVPGGAVQVDLSVIDLDSKQPRRRFGREALADLSESIRQHGVLEPVSVRHHPDAAGRYIVNRGERRVRAARLCGLDTVPVFVDDRVDPFAQAAENLHREDMSAFDLALFIAEREQEGFSRAEIARRLTKPRSFITEAASLNKAPALLLDAVRAGRVSEDVRTLYRLVSAGHDAPGLLQAVLERPDSIHRANVETLIANARGGHSDPRFAGPAAALMRSGGRTVLVVEHAGRRGSLRLKARDADVGEVRFGDGTRCDVPLVELKLVCWAAE